MGGTQKPTRLVKPRGKSLRLITDEDVAAVEEL